MSMREENLFIQENSITNHHVFFFWMKSTQISKQCDDYLKGLSYPPFIIQVTVILIVVLDEKGGNECPSSTPQDTHQRSITLFSYLIIVVQYLGLGTSSTAPRPQLGFIEPWTLLRDHKFLYDGWLVPVTTPHLFFPVWGKIPLSQQSHIPFTGCVQQHEPSLPRKAQRAVRSSQYFYYISGDLEDEELKRPLLRLSHCPPRCYMSPIYSKYTLIKDN